MEILFWLALVLLVIMVVGHVLWVIVRAILRFVFSGLRSEKPVESINTSICSNCDCVVSINTVFCGKCGARQKTGIVPELLKDLAATERQLERFFRAGALDNEVYLDLKNRIAAERTRLSEKQAPPKPATAPPQPVVAVAAPAPPEQSAPVITIEAAD